MKPKTQTPLTDVEQARAEVTRLNAAEQRFAGLFRAKIEQLAGVRSRRGKQVLDAGDPTAVATEVSRQIRQLEDEGAAIAEAAGEARRARLVAISSVFQVEAQQLERDAADAERQAVEQETKSKQLRKALEDHDHCAYAPRLPQMPDRSTGGGSLTVVQVPTPLFTRLRMRAQALRAQAVQTRMKQPHAAGGIEARGAA